MGHDNTSEHACSYELAYRWGTSMPELPARGRISIVLLLFPLAIRIRSLEQLARKSSPRSQETTSTPTIANDAHMLVPVLVPLPPFHFHKHCHYQLTAITTTTTATATATTTTMTTMTTAAGGDGGGNLAPRRVPVLLRFLAFQELLYYCCDYYNWGYNYCSSYLYSYCC